MLILFWMWFWFWLWEEGCWVEKGFERCILLRSWMSGWRWPIGRWRWWWWSVHVWKENFGLGGERDVVVVRFGNVVEGGDVI